MGNFENFVNPETIGAIGLGEKIITSLFVTLLGMGITFVALIAIWGMTVLMSKIIMGIENKNKIAQAATVEVSKPSAASAPAAPAPAVSAEASQEDENLIAVLTAAIAASLNTSMHNIVVRNVRQLPDQTPTWSRVGRTEQMGSRF
ncbi:OadG family protein [Acidaminobacter sp.]|uniref:OadG family protein n=1 Tax=Acidaminobacter sp. TaxID=1872102 RepID=UPI00137FD21F|nr:OadG family protein [Acidaminobacter sp.]MDK9712159.1 OadG family protein [Acidaminobacter sp.]MZQ96190.1 sodium pump decarboxylase subunit gamma [Acidaminobacter sp.]